MKYKIITAIALLAFVYSVAGGAPVERSKNRTGQLAALLPASDGVITLAPARLFHSILPLILSADPTALLKVNAGLDEVANKTGIDLRKFEEVAIGLKVNMVSGKQPDFEPILLARGDIDLKSLETVAKMAYKGKFRTEKIGNRIVHIFSSEKIIEKNKPTTGDAARPTLEKVLDSLSTDVALTAFDDNTIVLGTLARVKETIGNAPRVESDVLSLLNHKPNAAAKMGINLPNGIGSFLKLDNKKQLDITIGSVNQLHGSFDINDGNAYFSFMVKTQREKEAQDLEATLSGFHNMGKLYFLTQKGADNQVYARMLNNVKISRKAQSVMINLDIQKSDIDTLLGVITKKVVERN